MAAVGGESSILTSPEVTAEPDADASEQASAASNSPRAMFSEGDINPGGTFVAELGLLKSLKKPRNFNRVEKSGRQLKEISILKDEDGNPIAPEYVHPFPPPQRASSARRSLFYHFVFSCCCACTRVYVWCGCGVVVMWGGRALQQYRVDHDAEYNRISQAELDEVKSLHHQGIKAALSSTGLRKIKNLACVAPGVRVCVLVVCAMCDCRHHLTNYCVAAEKNARHVTTKPFPSTQKTVSRCTRRLRHGCCKPGRT